MENYELRIGNFVRLNSQNTIPRIQAKLYD